MRTTITKILIILSIILLGLFFRIFEKTPSSLWTDEFATYWISSAPSLAECTSRATPTQGQSPFYYILEWIVLKISPHTENSMRLISILASLISIYLIYEIALLFFATTNKPKSTEAPHCETTKDIQSPNHPTRAIATVPNGKISKSQILSLPAIFAALLFAFDTTQIYYAQEARPYALAIMFSLLSQLFFMKLLRKYSIDNMSLYIIFSALIIYTHYIFGTMLLVQNIWVLILLLRSKRKTDKSPITLAGWCTVQLILIGVLFPLMIHLVPIIRRSSKWTWLKSGGLIDSVAVFRTLFNLYIVVMFLILFILFTIYKFDIRHTSRSLKKSNLYYLIIWFITPPLFAYSATQILNTSLLDSRYMLLSLIPFYLLAAYLLNSLKSQQAKFFLVSFILFAYLGGILLPSLKRNGRFSYRIPHDWRGAIAHLNKNLKPNDVIILRSGFVKENWLPETGKPIIHEYVKAPLNSFYFKPDIFTKSENHTDSLNIYNMTYTKEREFYPYYDTIFDDCEKRPRVWIMGVNPPNTNYLVSQLPEILRNSHKKYFEKDFSGVYLVLLKKRKIVYKRFKP